MAMLMSVYAGIAQTNRNVKKVETKAEAPKPKPVTSVVNATVTTAAAAP
ncbi:MAG: hypothetical protein JWQ30_2226, partial [Sediminibacterium sp.]|nr:hypothetical protein [Sediminibacterium sp.]